MIYTPQDVSLLIKMRSFNTPSTIFEFWSKFREHPQKVRYICSRKGHWPDVPDARPFLHSYLPLFWNKLCFNPFPSLFLIFFIDTVKFWCSLSRLLSLYLSRISVFSCEERGLLTIRQVVKPINPKCKYFESSMVEITLRNSTQLIKS